MIRRPSPNFNDRPAPPDMLVLHYTGMLSAGAAIDRLCDPAAEVSAHYLVDEDGAIYALVDEAKRAWHAGISYWRGRSNLNDRSIGIEIVNPGHEWGYRPFADAQIAAVTALCADILARHAIPPAHVVGHSDIAPTRKQDPGELFPWARLAAAGIGLWPAVDGAGAAAIAAPALLDRIGYDPDAPLDRRIAAFQRHWRQDGVTGRADAGTMAAMAALLAKMGG